MKKFYYYFAPVLAVLLISTQSSARTLITCGASQGYSYYFAGKLIPKDKSGWVKDGFSKGKIALTLSGKTVDILFSDATGMKSASSNGAKVVTLDTSKSSVTVLVLYPKETAEIYTFNLVKKFVLWSQQKYGNSIQKGAMFVASCQ